MKSWQSRKGSKDPISQHNHISCSVTDGFPCFPFYLSFKETILFLSSCMMIFKLGRQHEAYFLKHIILFITVLPLAYCLLFLCLFLCCCRLFFLFFFCFFFFKSVKSLDWCGQCWESSFSFQVEQNAIYYVFLAVKQIIKRGQQKPALQKVPAH